MNIRAFNAEDAPDIAPLGAAFFEEASLPGIFSIPVFSETWRILLESGSGYGYGIFEGSKLFGGVGAYITPDPFTGDIVASEAFYYISPAARGVGLPLLGMLEEGARQREAKRVHMIHLEGPRADTLRKLYERRGYRLIEHVYTKEL